MTVAMMVLALVTLQRLAELVIAQRHTSALLAKGAYEVAPEHYPLIVAVHTAWLAGLWWRAGVANLPPNWAWLGVFVLLQLARLWVLATLGERWTTRIIILPGAPRVTAGPFRWMSHPNYAVVIGEIAVLPIAFGLYGFAIAFSILNAAVLAIRIGAENRAWRAMT